MDPADRDERHLRDGLGDESSWSPKGKLLSKIVAGDEYHGSGVASVIASRGQSRYASRTSLVPENGRVKHTIQIRSAYRQPLAAVDQTRSLNSSLISAYVVIQAVDEPFGVFKR
jgi:hypothetical protein